MKRFGSKQLIPIAMALMGVVFAVVGFTQLGFWDKEPKAGFFPSIIAVVHGDFQCGRILPDTERGG